jgi:hypothetical protein
MLKSRPKPWSLTWAGCASLLAIGSLLLPLRPVRAEAPAKKGKPIIFVIGGGADGLPIVPGADESPEEKALKLLKQARKILTEGKKGRPTGDGKKPNPEKVNAAKREVDALAKQLAKQRREMQLTEARLRQAKARLAQLEGKAGLRIGGPLQLKFLIRTDQGAPKFKIKGTDGKAIVVPERFLFRIQDGKIIGVSGKKEKPDQLKDLEARVDRLLREVQALRREVQRSTQPRK